MKAALLETQVRSYKELITGGVPDITWLVDSLIVQGSRVLLYGDPGSMKTWLALNLGLHIAAGKPWLGRFSIPEAQRVLYLDEEMGESEVARRVKQLALGLNLGDTELPFHTLSHTGIRFTPEGIATLAESVSRINPRVIIVDTLRRVLVGSENDQSDVTAFWRNVIPLIAGGRTVIILHHMRKTGQAGGGDAKYRASGHFDLIAGGDSSYAISKSREEDGTSIITWRCTKLRGAEEPNEFTVKVSDDPDTEATVIKFGDFASKAPITPQKISAVLALCGQHPALTHGAIYTLEQDRLKPLGVSRATYYRIVLEHPCAHILPHSQPIEPGASPESASTAAPSTDDAGSSAS